MRRADVLCDFAGHGVDDEERAEHLGILLGECAGERDRSGRTGHDQRGHVKRHTGCGKLQGDLERFPGKAQRADRVQQVGHRAAHDLRHLQDVGR